MIHSVSQKQTLDSIISRASRLKVDLQNGRSASSRNTGSLQRPYFAGTCLVMASGSLPLVFTFDPRETDKETVEIADFVAMPETACQVAERIIDNQAWYDLLKDQDEKMHHVLDAAPRERLQVFATSGLASHRPDKDGDTLERIVFGSVERAFKSENIPHLYPLFDAAFLMLRIYLQGRCVLVVSGNNRSWLADTLGTAVQKVRPFVFCDAEDQVNLVCRLLRSSDEMSVLISLGKPCWKSHWTQVMATNGVLQTIAAYYAVQAPTFSEELLSVSQRAVKHLSDSFYEELLALENNESFTFDLFANMASITGDAFNLSPLSDCHVFE